MKVVAYYASEIRTGEFDNKLVSLVFEIGNAGSRLFRKEYVDIRNIYISSTGCLIDVLLPETEHLSTLNKIEIYEGETLIKQIIGPKNPIYKIYTPTNRETGVDLLNPMLIELFLFDL